MTELSPDAQRVLASYQAARAPTAEREADAYARLQRELTRNRTVSGPVVTARFRRVRQARLLFRSLRRAALTGVAVFGVVWFLDRGVPQMRSDEMLEDAREHLDAGRHEDAYNVLLQHSRRFPTRDMAEARMGLVVDALCGLGMPQKARMDLERYLVLVPESVHGDRILHPCAGILGPAAYEPPQDVQSTVVSPDSAVDGPRRPPPPDWMPVDDQFGTSVRQGEN